MNELLCLGEGFGIGILLYLDEFGKFVLSDGFYFYYGIGGFYYLGNVFF